MIQIKRFTFNPVSVNAYLLWDETGEAVLIDPACNDADEEDELDYFVDRQGLKMVHLLNTHGHFDHLMGNRFAESKWNLTCQIHPAEASLVARACQQAALFGIQMSDPGDPVASLQEGQPIRFGNSRLQVIHVPGHSPGGVAFWSEEDQLLFPGDILFAGSVGRTDLPGGNHQLLLSGIREKLMPLPDITRVFPGHGGETSIGLERKTNPFLVG